MNPSALISIVDDDDAVRMTLQSFFKSLGFKVSLYAKAEDFLRVLSQEVPDCLILDVGLEGLDGPGLQRILINSGRSIPTIFITANIPEVVRRRVIEDGAVDLLMKPFDEDELLGALQKVFPDTSL